MSFSIELNGHRVSLEPNVWKWHSDSFEACLMPVERDVWAVVMHNGAIGHGDPCAFGFDCITIHAPGPVKMHPRVARGFGTDGRIQIGSPNGIKHNYFPVGGIMVVRFVTGKASVDEIYTRPAIKTTTNLLTKPIAGQDVVARASFNAMLAATQTGIPNNAMELYACMGPWMPLGSPDPGIQGGVGINPLPGWEGSSEYSLLRVDLTAERMPIAYTSMGGIPKMAADQPDYRATGGWGKWTKHQEFVVRDDGSTDPDARKPKQRDVGPAISYVQKLDSYQAHDAQHRIRATADAIVGWYRYGDPVSRWLLDMYACDAFMGLDPGIMSPEPGNGSVLFGRAYAWTLHALYAAARVPQYELLGRLASKVRMQNKAWMRAPSHLEDSLYWTPSPWRDAKVPRETDVYPTREGCFLALALALIGYREQAEEYGRGLMLADFKGIPQNFTGVGENDSPSDAQFGAWGGVESFNVWPLVGFLARTDKRTWGTYMTRMVPPGESLVCGRDIKGALTKAGNYQVSAAALEVVS